MKTGSAPSVLRKLRAARLLRGFISRGGRKRGAPARGPQLAQRGQSAQAPAPPFSPPGVRSVPSLSPALSQWLYGDPPRCHDPASLPKADTRPLPPRFRDLFLTQNDAGRLSAPPSSRSLAVALPLFFPRSTPGCDHRNEVFIGLGCLLLRARGHKRQ